MTQKRGDIALRWSHLHGRLTMFVSYISFPLVRLDIKSVYVLGTAAYLIAIMLLIL